MLLSLLKLERGAERAVFGIIRCVHVRGILIPSCMCFFSQIIMQSIQLSTQAITGYTFTSTNFTAQGSSSELRPALRALYSVTSYTQLQRDAVLSDRDNALQSIATILPFGFPYYNGLSYYQLKVSTNGLVLFDSYDGSTGTNAGGHRLDLDAMLFTYTVSRCILLRLVPCVLSVHAYTMHSDASGCVLCSNTACCTVLY
jgi:hypothetical protein